MRTRSLVRAALTRTLGPSETDKTSGLYHAALAETAFWLSPSVRHEANRIKQFRNQYIDKRCFIIGNGPSLSEMDLSCLRHEITFGQNRIYLMFERLGFHTSFIVCVNSYVLLQSGLDMLTFPMPKFFSSRARDMFEQHGDVYFVRETGGPRFSTDMARRGQWTGSTVTFVSLQLAFYMGFREVILIGVDHSFATQGPPNLLVTSQADDPNHFSPDYFGPGYRWQLPDLAKSEQAYRLARSAFEARGRRVIDATRAGNLRVFPKVPFESLF